jgi:phytoene synthase
MDLTIKSYETFDELRIYCYRVASIVGLCSLHVFGFGDPFAKDLAEQCGIAFQLTNILRDVHEDAEDGRCYLPQEEMKRFGVRPDFLVSREASDALVKFLHFQAARARAYYEQSWPLIGLVAVESRAALWTMIAIYRRLLETIDRDPAAVLKRRVGLTLYEKMSFAARGMAMVVKTRMGLREGRVPDWQPLA